jgi:hypothetical protein
MRLSPSPIVARRSPARSSDGVRHRPQPKAGLARIPSRVARWRSPHRQLPVVRSQAERKTNLMSENTLKQRVLDVLRSTDHVSLVDLMKQFGDDTDEVRTAIIELMEEQAIVLNVALPPTEVPPTAKPATKPRIARRQVRP